MIVVSDTSPVSSLYRISHHWLLEKVFGQVIVPPVVMQELESLKNFGFDISPLKSLPWLKVCRVNNAVEVLKLQPLLDPGESEAIVLAKELKADFILIDEKEGRRIAQQEGLQIIGLLGVLSASKKQGHIPAIKPVLDDLENNANFWLSPSLYQPYLHGEGE